MPPPLGFTPGLGLGAGLGSSFFLASWTAGRCVRPVFPFWAIAGAVRARPKSSAMYFMLSFCVCRCGGQELKGAREEEPTQAL